MPTEPRAPHAHSTCPFARRHGQCTRLRTAQVTQHAGMTAVDQLPTSCMSQPPLVLEFAEHSRELSRFSQMPFSCASVWQGLRFAVQKHFGRVAASGAVLCVRRARPGSSLGRTAELILDKLFGQKDSKKISLPPIVDTDAVQKRLCRKEIDCADFGNDCAEINGLCSFCNRPCSFRN